jgi:hypothetical protein
MKTFNVSCIHVFLNTQHNFIWNHAGFLGIEVLLHTQNHECDQFWWDNMQGFGHWSFAPYPKPWMWSILMRQHSGFRVLLNWNVLKKLDSHSMGGSVVDVVWKCGGIILEICTHAFDSELGNHLFGVTSKLAQTQTLGFPSNSFVYKKLCEVLRNYYY